MMQYLLAADVDQIQGYIFGTVRMRTIRGASALVALLGEQVRSLAPTVSPSCQCLRHQGGQFVFIAQEPEKLAQMIQQETQKIGGGALGITIGWEAYPGAEHFAQTQAAVFHKIKHLKETNQRGGRSSGILGGGFIRHCDLCKQYPAMPNPEKPAELIWSPGDDPAEARHLCLACWKRKQGAEAIKMDQQLDDAIRAEQARLKKPVWPADFQPKFPADLEQIWPPGQEGRLIGIVAADGDGIGQLLDKIPDPQLYQRFADAIEKVSLKAVARAACAIGLDRKKSGWIDLLPIIYGGDDLTLFLPAEKVLSFALALGNAFADLTGKDPSLANDPDTQAIQQVLSLCRPGETHLTLSMGVVAAKPSFPFVALHRLAGELRKNAKRQRASRKITEGMLDFAMITSANAEKLETMRKHYARTEAGAEYSLTSWPYTFSDLANLLTLCSQVTAEVPQRSQRKYMYSEFWRTRPAAEAAYRALVKKSGLENTRKTLQAFGCSKPKQTPFSGAQSERTVLLDALEITELVEERRPA